MPISKPKPNSIELLNYQDETYSTYKKLSDSSLVDEDGNQLTIDASTGALVRISYPHHETHDGNHYFISAFAVFNTDEEAVFGVTTPDSTKEPHITFLVVGTSQTEIYVYESSTFTGGVEIESINNNRNSTNTADLTVTSAPTVSDVGTLIFAQSTGKAGVNPTKSDSGTYERANELILKRNTAYIFKAVSRDDGNVISYRSDWYEHTPRG